jgi:hypothetical protein
MWKKINTYRLLLGKTEGTGLLGKPRGDRWEGNIKMDLTELRRGPNEFTCLGLFQGAVSNSNYTASDV